MTGTMDTRARAGVVLAAVVAMLLIAIGGNVMVQAAHRSTAVADGVLLFAVREVFLGVLCIVLVFRQEWRGLFLLFVVALFLPVADSLLLAFGGNHTLRASLLANLPFELPLILVCVLLTPAARGKKGGG